ncbi:MAG: Lysylphosphatidylglycerol synthase region [Miltoncostaeaceae bacterium]|jgi:uncharacterized membrane protein YbhN (UPF0104 family)|nr:Lysylphosphatidylglycerol synthase region [Miltoncostaeaceae bacterium]
MGGRYPAVVRPVPTPAAMRPGLLGRRLRATWRRVPRSLRTTLIGTVWGGGILVVLWLVARSLDPASVLGAFETVKWSWIVIAAACYATGLLAGAASWRVGLSAGGLAGVPFRHIVASQWIGQGVGAVLPGHMGEAARLLALRRHLSAEGGRGARIAGTMAAQHVLDGMAIMLLVVVASFAVPVPGALADLRWIALALLILTPASLLLARPGGLGRRLAARLPERAQRVLANFADGAAVLMRRQALTAFAWQAVAIGGRFGALLCLVYAFALGVPLSAALLVFAMLAAAAVIPAAPGGLGAKQAAVVVPLGAVYGVASEQALALSLGFQATLAAVALTGGLVALVHQRLEAPRIRLA